MYIDPYRLVLSLQSVLLLSIRQPQTILKLNDKQAIQILFLASYYVNEEKLNVYRPLPVGVVFTIGLVIVDMPTVEGIESKKARAKKYLIPFLRPKN